MSLWNFLGAMALFDLIFGKKRRGNANYGAAASNSSWCDVAAVHEREDKLQDLLDLLEDKLYECDEDSELYDDLQAEIDDLQDRLDEMEYLDNSDLWNDLYDHPDPFHDDPDDW